MLNNFKYFNNFAKIIAVLLIFLSSHHVVSAASIIHGTVYDLNLNKVENAVVDIDTTPKQQLIAKNGTYRFTVNPGNYKIKATLYNGRIIKSTADENISIVQEGDYVLDIILFPNFQEEEDIINSSESSGDINVSSVDFEKTENSLYLIAFIAILALLIVSVIFYFKLTSDALNKHRSKTKVDARKIIRRVKPINIKDTKKSSRVADAIENKLDEKRLDAEEYAETKTAQIKEPQEKISKVGLNRLDKDLENLIEFIKKQEGRTTQKDIRNNFTHSEAKISLMIAELEDKEIVKKLKKGRGNIIILKDKNV